MTPHFTLHHPIVSLHLKDSVGIKSRLSELAVNIGGDYEIIFILDEVQQFQVKRLCTRTKADIVNVTRPPRPPLRFSGEFVKA